MARHFVRLKLILLAASLRQGWQRMAGLIGGAVIALPAAVAAAAGLAVAGRVAEWGGAALILVLSLLAVGWTVGPLIAFGLDETLDAARLQLLPLRRGQLLTGLLAASAVGIAPLATLVVLGGAVAGFAPLRAEALVVVTAAAGHFLLCLVAGRAIVTAVSRHLRSRRGRDLMVLLAGLSGLLVAGAAQLPGLLAERLAEGPRSFGEVVELVARPLGLLPAGWAAQSIAAAAEGQILAALGWLAALAGLIAALAWWWMSALEAAMTVHSESHATAADVDLFPRAARWLPRTRVGAATARELRYLWRVPQLRVQTLMTPLVGAGLIAAVALWEPISRPEAVLAAALLAMLPVLNGLNLFGADRGAVWLLVVTGRRGRADLIGKNLAGALLLLPTLLVTMIAVAALTGGWSLLWIALAGAAALLAAGYAVGAVASVLAPVPLADSPTSAWTGATGAGCATMLLQTAAFLVQGLLILPVALGGGLALFLRPALLPVIALASLAYAAALWWAGMSLGGRWLDTRAPEFVTALSRKVG